MAKSTSSLASSTSSSSSSGSLSSRSSDRSLSLKSSSSIDRRKRLAANARERKRMHLLNKAYDQLRLKLVDAENKSKYDVLVQAKEYIQALAGIAHNGDVATVTAHQQHAHLNITLTNKHAYTCMTANRNMTISGFTATNSH